MMSSGINGTKRRLHDVTEDFPIVRALRFKPNDRRDSNVFQTESQNESEFPGHPSSHIEADANTTFLRHQSHSEELRGESCSQPLTCTNQSMLENSRVASSPPGLINVQELYDFIETTVAKRMEHAQNKRCGIGMVSQLSTAQEGALCTTSTDKTHTDEESWRLEWNSKCKDFLPGIRDLFSVEVIEMDIVRPLMRFLSSTIASAGHGTSVSDACEAVVKDFEGVRFSKKNGTTKSIWDSNLGQKGQEFRLLTAQSVLSFVNCSASSILYPDSDNVDRHSIPSWIREGLVRDDDLRGVQNRKTRTGWSIGRRLRSKSPTASDLTIFACETLFENISKSLVRRRRSIKTSFFASIGYTLVPWKDYPVNYEQGHEGQRFLDQGTLEYVLGTGKISVSRRQSEVSESSFIADVNLSEIPLCIEVSNGVSESQADAQNLARFHRMKKRFEGLSISMTHEVIVKGRYEEERRFVRRLVNFVDSTALMLAAFGRTDDIPFMLRSSSYSLRSIVCLAFVQFELFQDVVSRRTAENKDYFPDLSLFENRGLNLASLLPAPSKARDVLSRSPLFLNPKSGVYRHCVIDSNESQEFSS